MENALTIATNDFATVDLIDNFKNPASKFYCSIENDGSRKRQIEIYNAVNNADEAIADHIGEVLEIVNVVAHPVEIVNEESGEIVSVLRTVLIDKTGKTFTATSVGIASALNKIFSIVGTPDGGAWMKEPVKMKIKQVKTNNGVNKVNTIELVY